MKLKTIWMDPENQEKAHSITCGMRTAVLSASKSSSQLVCDFIESYPFILNKGFFLRKLADAVNRDPGYSQDLTETLTDEIEKTIDGAVFVWSIMQRLKQPHSPERLLHNGDWSTDERADLTARAWCNWLLNPAVTMKSAESMCDAIECHPSAYGFYLLILDHYDMQDRIDRIFDRWSAGPKNREDLTDILSGMLASKRLRGHAERMMATAAFEYSDDLQMLRALCGIACEHQLYQDVLLISNRIISNGQTTCHSGLWYEADAWRIRALTGLKKSGPALLEYENHWLGSSHSFPFAPELLIVAQDSERQSVAEHILEHLPEPGADMPMGWDWVYLSRLDHQGRQAETLDGWKKLMETDTTLRSVTGFTKAMLKVPYGRIRLEDSKRLCRFWEDLTTLPDYVEMAHCVLTVLDYWKGNHLEVIQRFRGNLEYLAVEPGWPMQACRAYAWSLVFNKLWNDLTPLFSKEHRHSLEHLMSFEEHQFFLNMARVHNHQESGGPAAWRDWIEGWERLLCLPLTPHMLGLVIEQFAHLGRILSSSMPECTRPDFEDLSLQVERKGKAVLEAMAERAVTPDAGSYLAGLERQGTGHLRDMLSLFSRMEGYYEH